MKAYVRVKRSGDCMYVNLKDKSETVLDNEAFGYMVAVLSVDENLKQQAVDWFFSGDWRHIPNGEKS